jgi:excisionase family DNA binding protein
VSNDTTAGPRRTLTVVEAAAVLGISRASAYEAVRRNELPGARRIGGRIVVSRDELDRYLRGNAQPEVAA